MSVRVTAYEITCDGCAEELGTHHEFIAQSLDSGVVVLTFFGLLHTCEGVTDEDVATAKENVQWGPWSPDRRRQKAVSG